MATPARRKVGGGPDVPRAPGPRPVPAREREGLHGSARPVVAGTRAPDDGRPDHHLPAGLIGELGADLTEEGVEAVDAGDVPAQRREPVPGDRSELRCWSTAS